MIAPPAVLGLKRRNPVIGSFAARTRIPFFEFVCYVGIAAGGAFEDRKDVLSRKRIDASRHVFKIVCGKLWAVGIVFVLFHGNTPLV